MTRYIPREKLEHLIWKPGETAPALPQPKPVPHQKEATEGRYILMPRTATYAQGLHALHNACQADENSIHPGFMLDDGSKVYRPLTFKEDITARVTDYNTLHNPDGTERTPEERLKLCTERWLDSCTAIAYQKGTGKFKVVLQSKELITLPEDFNSGYLPISYNDIAGIELDRTGATYNNRLTKSQVENHPAWRAAVGDDITLLKEYRDIVFANPSRDTAMGFWLRTDIPEDQLWALFVSDLGNSSIASGYEYLNYNGSFLLVAPSRKKK
jgi:hypothetical protein